MRYLSFTLTGNVAHRLPIYSYDGFKLPPYLSDYSCVSSGSSQNVMRKHLAIIMRYSTEAGKNRSLSSDLIVSYEGSRNEYRLWTYSRNFVGREAWFAGMIHVRMKQINKHKLHQLL